MQYKILFIDDELNILNSLQREFKDWIYEARFAQTPAAALELLENNDFAAVITDMRMPEMSGIELLNLIKVKYPEIIRIVLSGYSDKDMIINAINQGSIYHYLIKPCDMEDLKLTISNAVDCFREQYEKRKLMAILTEESMELNEKNLILYDELINKAIQIMTQKKELKIANEKLKTLDKNKSNFMKLVSHELFTPLSILMGYLEIMRDGYDDKFNTNDCVNILNVMSESAQRLKDIIHEILTVLQLENPGQLYLIEKHNIVDLIKLVIENFKIFSEKKTLSLTFKNHLNNNIILQIDKNRIRIAIENLIKNAIENTNTNGSVEVILDEYFLNNDKYVKFIVKDNGCGIPDDKINEIWNKFEIAHDIYNHQRGIGLGLTLTRQIIEGHSGKIWVKSEKSKGSEFIFILPTI